MRKLVILTMVLAGGTVWAQAADKKAPASAPAAAAAAAPAKPPEKPPEMKPAPELKAEYGGMIGTWKCNGKGSMGGHEMKSTGTYKAEWGLDNYWVVAKAEEKMVGMPMSHKSIDIYGYDATTKEFTQLSVDNMGGWSMTKSKGWQGDSEEWVGTGNMMGKTSEVKWSITKKGDKEVTVKGTMGTDSFEDNCKK
jgi:hypothetical protein